MGNFGTSDRGTFVNSGNGFIATGFGSPEGGTLVKSRGCPPLRFLVCFLYLFWYLRVPFICILKRIKSNAVAIILHNGRPTPHTSRKERKGQGETGIQSEDSPSKAYTTGKERKQRKYQRQAQVNLSLSQSFSISVEASHTLLRTLQA